MQIIMLYNSGSTPDGTGGACTADMLHFRLQFSHDLAHSYKWKMALLTIDISSDCCLAALA